MSWFSQMRADLEIERKERERLRLEELAAQEKKAAEQTAKREQYHRNCETLRAVRSFPGSKKEFEDFIGYRCEIIDLQSIHPEHSDEGLVMRLHSHDRFMDYDADYQQALIDNGLVALVNAVPISTSRNGDDHGRYGLPVRKVRDWGRRG